MRSLLLTALLALAVLGVLRAQGPDTLTAGDLMVAGVPDGADSGVIRRLLGRPDSITHFDHPDDDGIRATLWYYRAGVVTLGNHGERYLITIRTEAWRTKRGVSVGDPEARVRQVYGSPMYEEARHLLYACSNGVSETRGIDFTLENGRVVKIEVGNVISVD